MGTVSDVQERDPDSRGEQDSVSIASQKETIKEVEDELADPSVQVQFLEAKINEYQKRLDKLKSALEPGV